MAPVNSPTLASALVLALALALTSSGPGPVDARGPRSLATRRLRPKAIARVQRTNDNSFSESTDGVSKYSFPGGVFTPTNINYNGGPIMNQTVKVYLCYVGDRWTKDQRNLVSAFLASLNPSTDSTNTMDDWWTINTWYYGGRGPMYGQPSGGWVSNNLSTAGAVTLTSYGVIDLVGNRTMLSDENIWTIVSFAIKYAWPVDYNGIYVVFTDSYYQQGTLGSASCSQYCGWHNARRYNGIPLKYVWLGILTSCPSACSPAPIVKNGPPSHDAGIHGALSVLAHELAEATSDPEISAWYSSTGDENADLCAWKYGIAPGINFNQVGPTGQKFLIQQNLNPVTGQCTNGGDPVPSPPPPSPPPPPPKKKCCPATKWICFPCFF